MAGTELVGAMMWNDLPEQLVAECAADREAPYCWCGEHSPGREPRHTWADDDRNERETSEDDHIMWG